VGIATLQEHRSNLNKNVRESIKNRPIPNPFPPGSDPSSSCLLAESELTNRQDVGWAVAERSRSAAHVHCSR
jgi:hypothetical protein